jgi:signal transduction histidine kinase
MRAIFFSSVAHELRTPLNSIIPLIRLMLEGMATTLDERAKNYLKIILNSSLHLENVIEDALDMSRLENNKFSIFKEMVDIRSAIEEVCGIMKFQLTAKNLALNLKISKEVPSKVKTDIKRFKQVLFNLMGNASKFTFQGSLSVKIEFKNK